MAQDPADVKELAVLQRELLSTAIDSARPGGVIAYVTCTPHIAETRDVVTAVADGRDDITVLDAPAVLARSPTFAAPNPGAPRIRAIASSLSSGPIATAPTPFSWLCSDAGNPPGAFRRG